MAQTNLVTSSQTVRAIKPDDPGNDFDDYFDEVENHACDKIANLIHWPWEPATYLFFDGSLDPLQSLDHFAARFFDPLLNLTTDALRLFEAFLGFDPLILTLD